MEQMRKHGDVESRVEGTRVETRPVDRVIVRHRANSYPHICEYLVSHLGFTDLCHVPRDAAMKGKLGHLKDLLADCVYVVRHLSLIRGARVIFATGSSGMIIGLLCKLRLLRRCQRLFWIGFFVHDPKWFPPLRCTLAILDSPRIRYILFSKSEQYLYARVLHLDAGRMLYLPYGNMKKEMSGSSAEPAQPESLYEGDYYFSGGYSDRDYRSLIEVFRAMPCKLIVVCSSLNKEIKQIAIPRNVTIMFDLPSERFDAYLQKAKACIIPIKYDTGAAGQSCLLRYMKNKKLIIATATEIVKEYITDGVSGLLVRDNNEGMAAAVRAVEADSGRYSSYGVAAYERYVGVYSYEPMARRLEALINESVSSGQGCALPGS